MLSLREFAQFIGVSNPPISARGLASFVYGDSNLDVSLRELLQTFHVGFTEYAEGRVRGSVYYPAEGDGQGQPFAETGRFPIVVMAHGQHTPADPSYLGYDYFQRRLARMGMIAVSVDCNALNDGTSGVGNIEDRADLIIDSIRHFQALDANPGSIFFRHVDFSRVGLMGHSRGGDAAVTIPTVLPAIGVVIVAVLALAPTNWRYWASMPTIRPAGYAFMTILPASDGDVDDNNGAQFYDQAEPGPYKSQLYVHSTNHNFFNRQWLDDDGVTAVVSRADHERVLDVYGTAFFRSRLLGHQTETLLEGGTKPKGMLTDITHLSFMWAGQPTVDDHEDGNGIATNSLALPTTQSGGMAAAEYPFDQVAAAYNGSFFGLSTGMVIEPGQSGAIFRSSLGKTDIRDQEIWLRVAEVVDGPLPPDWTGFQLGLEDTSGTVAWVDSDSVGGVPRPFERPGRMKTMLNTLRFPSSSFKAANSSVDLDQITAVLIRPSGGRAVALDDLQLVRTRSGPHTRGRFTMTSDHPERDAPAPRPSSGVPDIVTVEIRRVALKPSPRRNFRSALPSVDDAVEFLVETDRPFPSRALGPALYVGETPVLEVTADDPTHYRFRSLEPDRLQRGAPLSLGWSGKPRSARRTTEFRFED